MQRPSQTLRQELVKSHRAFKNASHHNKYKDMTSATNFDQDRIKLVIGVVAPGKAIGQHKQFLRSVNLAVENINKAEADVRLYVIDSGIDLSHLESKVEVLRFDSAASTDLCGAMNKLMSAAFSDQTTDCFLCVNPDGILHYKALSELLLSNSAHAQSLIEAREFPEEHSKQYDPKTHETSWASRSCLLIPRKIFEVIGEFDPNLSTYLADVDFSWRARSAGFSVRVASNALFGHTEMRQTLSPHDEKRLLLSGRYLAFKWKNERFVEWAEKTLIERGFFQSLTELPALPQLNSNATAINPIVADFNHGLFFSQCRW